MTEITLLDGFGRRTTFKGKRLVSESTDTPEGRKPQYTEFTVWKTEAGQYVVLREVRYRIRHLDFECKRAADTNVVMRSPRSSDTFPCPACNSKYVVEGLDSRGNQIRRSIADHNEGWGQTHRTNLAVYKTPELLIEGLALVNPHTGAKTHSELSQAILADISEQDPAVASQWMSQVIR